MQKRGYIIRFIDIGLILLFGFLMISDLTVISRIQLHGIEADEQVPEVDENSRTISVRIEASGAFQVRERATDEVLFVDVTHLPDLEGLLHRLLQDARSSGGALDIIIEPDPAATMQRLVDVHDLCERLGLRKRIDTHFGRGL